jgi:hypothetical protein
MSADRDLDEDIYNDDEDDDDEADFSPGVDEEDDEDDFDEDDAEGSDKMPPFLEGNLHLDVSDGSAIVFEDSSFRLVSKEAVPSTWSLQNPFLEEPTKFVGWIQDPEEVMTFTVQILGQKSIIDPLDEKLLEAQRQKRALPVQNGDSKPPATAKSDGETQSKATLKSPPSYSKEPPANSLKQPPTAEGKKEAPQTSSENGIVYVVTGSQVAAGSADHNVQFRGLFHPPDAKLQKLFLICSVQVDRECPQQTASAATPPPAAAAARKRNRADDGDDESGDGDGAVEYQELIDLHDDAGLSTEELRSRYYGRGSDHDGKKPSVMKKRAKPSDDDDDDDAYGF